MLPTEDRIEFRPDVVVTIFGVVVAIIDVGVVDALDEVDAVVLERRNTLIPGFPVKKILSYLIGHSSPKVGQSFTILFRGVYSSIELDIIPHHHFKNSFSSPHFQGEYSIVVPHVHAAHPEIERSKPRRCSWTPSKHFIRLPTLR